MPGSLDLLGFQPIRFGFAPDTCANNDNRGYCMLQQDNDEIWWQLKRNRGLDITCDLSDAGAQLLLNPSFTSGSDWTFGGGWAQNGGDETADISISAGVLSQSVPSYADTTIYRVEIILFAGTTGLTVSLGGTAIATIAATSDPGTYTYITTGGNSNTLLEISTGGGGTARLADVNVYEFSSNCLTTIDPAITFSDGNFSVNGTGQLRFNLDMQPSVTYSPRITMFISSYLQGTVQFFFCSDLSDIIEPGNGTLSYTLNGSDSSNQGYGDYVIQFTDFVGTIESITFEQYSTDYYFSLNDINGDFVQSITGITYNKEWLTGRISLFGEGVPEGCYRIGLYDPFLHEAEWLEYEYDFTSGSPSFTETPGADWTLSAGPGYVYDASGANGNITTQINTAVTFIPIIVKTQYEMGGNIIAGGNVGTAYLCDTNTAICAGAGQNIATPDAIYRYNNQYGFPGMAEFGPTIDLTFDIIATAGDHIELKNLKYWVLPYTLDYLSNCISYKHSWPCTKALYGTAASENIGFEFSQSGFSLTTRMKCAFHPNKYPIKSDDDISSDGTRKLISGTLQKYRILAFDYVDEIAHDAIAGLHLCDEFYIDTVETGLSAGGTRYFIVPDDYQPEWDRDGKLNLAKGQITVVEYDQVKFKTNCT